MLSFRNSKNNNAANNNNHNGGSSTNIMFLKLLQGVDATTSSSSSSSFKIRLPPGSSNYEIDWDDEEALATTSSKRRRAGIVVVGSGREFNMFEFSPRGGDGGGSTGGSGGGSGGSFPYLDANNSNSNNNNNEKDTLDNIDDDFLERRYREQQQRRRRNNNNNNNNSLFSSSPFPGIQPPNRIINPFGNRQQRSSSTSSSTTSASRPSPKFIQNIQQWYVSQIIPRIQDLPKIVCRVEPTTTLKLRKTFRPLKTIIRVGADYNTQLGVWQFKSSWEDAIIGGKLTLKGKELQLTKSWQLSVGQLEDLVTRLRFRAAINLQTFQAYARVGFRTERITPINVMEGFSISRRIPLDGGGRSSKGIKMEVKANVALPEPEIEYSTEKQSRTLIGMGNIEVSIDEMNLVLDY